MIDGEFDVIVTYEIAMDCSEIDVVYVNDYANKNHC